jgi:hypothetical protein
MHPQSKALSLRERLVGDLAVTVGLLGAVAVLWLGGFVLVSGYRTWFGDVDGDWSVTLDGRKCRMHMARKPDGLAGLYECERDKGSVTGQVFGKGIQLRLSSDAFGAMPRDFTGEADGASIEASSPSGESLQASR